MELTIQIIALYKITYFQEDNSIQKTMAKYNYMEFALLKGRCVIIDGS